MASPRLVNLTFLNFKYLIFHRAISRLPNPTFQFVERDGETFLVLVEVEDSFQAANDDDVE